MTCWPQPPGPHGPSTSPSLAAAQPASVQVCEACAAEYDAAYARAECACGGLLALRHSCPIRGEALRRRFDDRLRHAAAPASLDAESTVCASGVWRFREMIMPGAARSDVVSQPEGNTPLMHRAAISRWAGLDALYLKHDGYNPTGSFKDRGMTVAMTQARRIGARAVACASTGNTSASLAAYAALAGIPGLVLVPASRGGVAQVATGKLAQTVAYGARTLLVRGDFDACLRLAREASEQLGVYLVNSVNPFRIEGQKSVALEILQQLRWTVPDWIVLPAGNLGNTSAVGTALRDALELGLITRLPRVASIQAAGAAPFAAAFREHFAQRRSVTAQTVASAIRIGNPASWDRAVRVIRETDGVVADVSDDELLAAKAAIDAAGVGCEPASAASVAGVRKLVADGVIAPRERVVAILTGHLLKDPAVFNTADGGPGVHVDAPVEIDATVSALAAVMEASAR